jgi:drug/metabolite transporter (DMT)-like permease
MRMEMGDPSPVPNDSVAVAVLAGLGGMVGWGVADFLGKWTIDRIGALPTLFWSQLIGVGPAVAFLAASGRIPALHGLDLLYLAAFGVVDAFAYLLIYVGFGKGKVSLLSPVYASYAALAVLLSAWLFHEHITGLQWAGIAVVFAGVLLVSRATAGASPAPAAPSRGAGLPEILVAFVLHGFWLVLFDRFLGERPFAIFVLGARLAVVLTLLAHARVTRQSLRVPDRGLFRPLLVVGVADVCAYAALAWGLGSSTHTSIVVILGSTFSVPTMVLARIFLKERLSRPQMAAVASIIGGIVLLSIRG